MRRSSWIALIWVLLSAVTACAQRYAFATYAQPEGLENLGVNVIVQDHAGFLWIGTENGLFRFEAGRFRRFGAAQGLDNGFIYNLHVDRAGRLWVATDDGLYVSQGSRFLDIRYQGRQLKVGDNSSFADAPGGGLLAVALASGVANRLYRVTAAGTQLVAQPAVLPPELAGAAIQGVLVTRAGDEWLGCGAGLCRVSDGRLTRFGPAQGVPAGVWQKLFEAADGTLWVRDVNDVLALAPGAAVFSPREAGLATARSNDVYLGIGQDAAGRILAPFAQGLGRWSPAEGGPSKAEGHWQLVGAAQGLPPYPVSALCMNCAGGAWLGITGHGLARWLGYGTIENWTPEEGLASPIIWSILQTGPRQVFVASEQGVDLLNPTTGKIQPWSSHLGADSRAVRYIRQGADGHVWFVNRAGSVIELDPGSGRLTRYPRISGHLMNALADSQNRLWIASTSGLYLVQPTPRGKRLTQVHDAGFDTSIFYTVAQSPSGGLWCAGRTGIFHLEASGWRKLDLSLTHFDPRSEDIVPMSDGSLWISNYVTALDHLWISADRVIRFETVDPPLLASDQIVFMEADRRGWLWVGNDHGLDVFNGVQWRRLTQDNGLLWNDLDVRAFDAAADGTLWFGTSAGITHLKDPASVFAPIQLRALITSLHLGAQDLLEASVPLAWRGKTLVAGFTALGAPSERTVRYRYRLRGLETDWTTTAMRQARYPSLPPGHYVFELVALDAAQHTASPPVSVSLAVLPPWWRSWPFDVGLGLLVLLLAFRVWRWREAVLLARQHALERQVAERTRELEAEKHELESAREALHIQATRDGLTQLWNRTAILARLSEEMDRAQRTQLPIAAVLVDLDHFKAVNDRFGHLRGDRVLCEAARRFESAARTYDGVGRYGGEEFLIVLPGLLPSDAPARLEQFRQAITGAPFLVDAAELRLTCSFGVAWAHRGQSIEEILDFADQALYTAKTEGRDRIAFAPEEKR